MCFGTRILSPFHLATQIVSIHNLKCLKNVKTTCADMIFRMIFHKCELWSALPNLQTFLPWMWNAFNIIIHIHLYHLPTSCWINHQKTALIVQLLYWPASKDDSASLRKAGIKIMSAHAFLRQLRLWMDTIWVARWNRLEILIPKHTWKSKIWLPEQKLDQKCYVTLF